MARLKKPEGLALRGNTLLVPNFQSGTVGEYDARTGAAINTSFVTGLTHPNGIAVKSAKVRFAVFSAKLESFSTTFQLTGPSLLVWTAMELTL